MLCHEQRVAWVGDQTGQVIGDAKATLGGSQEHDAAIGGDPPTVKGGSDFLVGNGWKQERQDRIVGHGGCGSA